MSKLVLNHVDQLQVSQFISNPAHLLVIVGPLGSGKFALATHIIESILSVPEGEIEKYPYFMALHPNKGTISIDSVRELKRFMRLKTTGSLALRRGIIIEQAESLTIEAQNSLLKLLEEPPSDTVIVITVQSSRAMLPTIYSRSQIITLRKPNKADLTDYFKGLGNESIDIDRVFKLTNGLPGLMTALLSTDNGHPMVESIDTAKHLLEITRYDRLLMINDLSKDKAKLRELISAIERVAQASLSQSISAGRGQNMTRWHNILKQSLKAEGQLSLNANPKLVLTNLFLTI